MAAAGLVAQVRALFGPKMAAVEDSLITHLGDCPETLREPARSVLQSGGKRLRPILHLLSADVFGYRGEGDVLLATVFEYVHVASLLHDDVIDEADLRRGSPSMNRQLGNTLSVLLGDHLCVKGLSLAARTGHPEIIRLVCNATLQLVEGEALQETQAGCIDLTAAEYLRAVERKTARLIAASCETAAVLAGASDADRERLRNYGLHLGMAFQIADDILDFAADAETLGKPVLADLAHGRLTLPVLCALEAGGAPAFDLVRTVLADRGFRQVSAETLVRLVRESGGLDAATTAAREFAATARGALDGLPESPSLEALRFATEYAITRTS